LNDIVSAAVSLMRNESRASIDLRLTPETLLVHVDVEAIRRILINLLKNAFQALTENRDGEIVVETVVFTAEDGSQTAVARVSDNGSGIPEELWTKIFVPSFSTKTSGTGLGLAIARKTIEDHDGDIGFETDEDSGSTFWIRLKCTIAGD
jgi:signal transduction histidine kinase